MKISRFALRTTTTILGLIHKASGYISVGQTAGSDHGGGKIVSIDWEPGDTAIRITKDSPSYGEQGKPERLGKAVLVPLNNVASFVAVDEKEARK